MSSSRKTSNHKFRNTKARNALQWHEFRDLLTRFFPELDLRESANATWAWEFFDAISEAFLAANIRERQKKRPSAETIVARLQQIEETALKLRELITGQQVSYENGKPMVENLSSDSENLSSHSSDPIWYSMTYAIRRDPNALASIVQVLPEIAETARLGRFWRLSRESEPKEDAEDAEVELEKTTKDAEASDLETPSKGRPKGTGDIFKDAFLVAMLPVWEMFAKDRPATFATGPEAEELCPFCSFMEIYFLEAGIGDDTAQAISARYTRALSLRRDIEKQ
jgi:hypothetical protein